jgi:beta-lactamase regulating signal transducer with metallopeptidase domain
MVLAGIFRPRLVVSRAVVQTLDRTQLAAAVRHERAHSASSDNLRRLAMLLAPGVAPGFRGFARIEQAWSRFAEWAADDRAVAGDPRRSVALAEALLSVARLGLVRPPHLLATPLLCAGEEIGRRVDRLLRPLSKPQPVFRQPVVLRACGACLLVTGAVAVLSGTGMLATVHEALERLIR